MAADKFGELLSNYFSSDFSILDNSISALHSLVDSADAQTRRSFFPKLEEAAFKFKGQSVSGLAKLGGFSPLAKVLIEFGKGGNFAHQERAFATLVQLLGAGATAEGIREEAGELAKMALAAIGMDQWGLKGPAEVRKAALHSLNGLLEKFPSNLPPQIWELFAELQAALLAILPDKSNEPIRQLAAQCLGQLVNFHLDPKSFFLLLSDMSSDCELMLKDDFLLDDLLEKAMGRENELEAEKRNSKMNGGKGEGGSGE